MVVVFAVLALAVIFLIAAIVIGREARRLDAVPPRAVFDLDEATEWVANHLPLDVSAVLSYADVRAILAVHLEFVQSAAATTGTVSPVDAAAYVRAHVSGDWLPEQVDAVLDAQMGYLDAIGAIGPEVDPGAGHDVL